MIDRSPPTLLHHLIDHSAVHSASAVALADASHSLTYAQLQQAVLTFAQGAAHLGVQRLDRIAIYLEKRIETVVACFGSSAAGCVFVPINPLLKPAQVAHILRDSGSRVLVTSRERAALLETTIAQCPELQHLIVVDGPPSGIQFALPCHAWTDFMGDSAQAPDQAAIISTAATAATDMAAILYTSGSTGQPKGVVLSHRNLVVGASSVAAYLDNQPDDKLLAVLPLSFDAGFSQLTTAFKVGAKVTLLNHLFPRDILKALAAERITGITAVPPVYIQLAELDWPPGIESHLRYFANTGGRMPGETLNTLRRKLPRTQPFLMYGLTEAFRSTYLDPAEVDRRPDSIGKAIPNAEVLVLRSDGSLCDADEPGELVHRGPLVSMGYWNDPEKTAQRFKPLPPNLAPRVDSPSATAGTPEIAVFSGDTVRRDAEGFLYFVGRRDEMIKTSGYRVSPTEVEEILYATQLVAECAAFGVAHPRLGQTIRVLAVAKNPENTTPEALIAECRQRMPAYMVPETIELLPGPLPRNPNGKIDRNTLAARFQPNSEPPSP